MCASDHQHQDLEYFRETSPVLGVFLDLDCSEARNVLDMANDSQLFTGHYDWLVLSQQNSSDTIRHRFEDVMMSVDTQLTYGVIDSRLAADTGSSFILYDIYNNGKHLGGKVNITLDRNVTCNKSSCETQHFSELYLRTKFKHRCHLNDTTFRVSTVVSTMSISLEEKVLEDYLLSTIDTHKDTGARFGYHIVIHLPEIMKFKVKHIFQDKWSFNETSGGTLGDLVDGKVEYTNAPYALSARRVMHAFPVMRIGDYVSVFLFRKPKNEGLYGSLFLSPFSNQVWIAFGCVILVFGIILWFMFLVEFRIGSYMNYIPSLPFTFLMSFGVACSQGSGLIPSTTGGRVAFFSLSAVTVIMYNYYTSTVVSTLVRSPMKSSIRTIEQLTDSKLELALAPRPYNRVFLNVSTLPEIKKFVDKRINGKWEDKSLWMDDEQGILRVKEGGFAYNSDSWGAYKMVEKYFEQHEICDLNTVNLRRSYLVFLVGRNSTYKELFKLSFLRMMESGLIKKHEAVWITNKLNCFSNSVVIDVGYEYTGPLFILLAIGYAASFFGCIIEVILHKYTAIVGK